MTVRIAGRVAPARYELDGGERAPGDTGVPVSPGPQQPFVDRRRGGERRQGERRFEPRADGPDRRSGEDRRQGHWRCQAATARTPEV